MFSAVHILFAKDHGLFYLIHKINEVRKSDHVDGILVYIMYGLVCIVWTTCILCIVWSVLCIVLSV